MDVNSEQHAASWLRPEAPRTTYDSAPGMLPSEDIGDMFPPHFIDSNAGHMNPRYYNHQAMGYRPSTGEFYTYAYFLLSFNICNNLHNIYLKLFDLKTV